MQTLRARLTLGVLCLIAVLVLGLAVLEHLALRGFLVEGEASRVRAQSKALIDAAALTDLTPARAGILATDLTSADTGALVLAPDGSVLGAPAPGTVGAPPPTDVPPEAVARAAAGDRGVDVVRDIGSERELLALVPEPGGSPPRVVIVLATPLAESDAVADQQLMTGLAGLAAALLLAGVGSLVVVGRSLRPLRRISRAAAEVASGDLGQRVGHGPPDEVGVLAGSFDAMTEALERSFGELAASEQRSREFVADASHELRTPLTTIAGFTDVLLRRPSEDDDATRLLAALRREVDRMQRVVDDLLLLARADQRLGSARFPLDLRHAAMRVVEQLRPVAGMRSLRVEGGPVRILSDPDRMHRILLNLLTNALRHTAEDGTVTLTTATTDDGGGSITVCDDGEGMDESIRATAFERFTRGGTPRGGGSGLGLAIVAALVEELDGQVDLVSAPGRGTSVCITLGSGK